MVHHAMSVIAGRQTMIEQVEAESYLMTESEKEKFFNEMSDSLYADYENGHLEQDLVKALLSVTRTRAMQHRLEKAIFHHLKPGDISDWLVKNRDG